MQAFSIVTGPAAPLFVSNVDTDTIIGHEAMSSSPEELAPYAFGALRYLPDGTANPGFVLNQPKYRAAPIMLAGPNFGCGSSRERAVWALVGIGIRCIVAPSFGGIFLANCYQNGLLPVILPEANVRELALQADADASFKVDLAAKTLSTSFGSAFAFEVDEMRRQSLLQGLDAIDMTLADAACIEAWQTEDRAARPWVWQQPSARG